VVFLVSAYSILLSFKASIVFLSNYSSGHFFAACGT
jgi:hypothetical protein